MRWWLAPLLGSSMVIAGLVIRDQLSTSWPWLAYNVVLAWIPLALGVAASRSPRALAILGLPWFAFLPNAPYLLTDLVHLRARPPVPIWFDAALLGGAGVLGLWMGVVSFARVHGAVRRWVGRGAAAALVALVPPAVGFGQYLGRFLRWNSWDLLVQPRSVLADALAPVLDPARHLEAWAFTVAFGGLFLVAALAHGESRPEGGTIGG
jgi:uncharacterized membrane protein